MHLRDDLGRLAAVYRAGQHLALFFDYDGALAPPVTHPALARCPDSTARLLAHFADLPRIGVGVLSNRTMDDLKAMVRLPKLIYVATSGLELEIKDLQIIHPRAEGYRVYLEHAIGTLRAIIAQFDGAWLEDKVLALTVHYLVVSRDHRTLLQQCLSHALNRYEGLLTLINGSAAAEILPDIGWAKGDTIRQIVESQTDFRLPLYAASDSSDSEAFRITAEVGGLTIGIGPTAPKNAMHRLADQESLANELAKFFDLLAPGACL